MAYKILRIDPEREGWDVTIQIIDDDKELHTLTFFWAGKEKPTKDDLANRVAHIMSNIANQAQEKQEVFTRDEVISLLVEKGYLKAGEDLDDLKEVTGIGG